MRTRSTTRLAAAIWAATLLLLLADGFLGAPASGTANAADAVSAVVFLLVLVGLTTLGALIAAREPGNAMGWLFVGLALAAALGVVASQYATAALAAGPSPAPAAVLAAALANWLSGPSLYSIFIFVFLVFPNGRPPGPRWRPVLRLAVGSSLTLLLIELFSPGPFVMQFPQVANPLGIAALGDLRGRLEGPVLLLQILLLILAVISLVVRFRQARGDERQQIKWLASGGVAAVAIFASGPIWWSMPGPGDVIWPVLFSLALAVIPVATGIAMLKYRLYAIDILIRRTLVYGVLTGSLLLLYWGGVVLLEGLLRPLTGTSHNELAIVASTLLIAALFTPLRHGIQAFIDRRFYRRKYDAAQTLAAFGTHLRDEVDLAALTGHLITVVDETMQPTAVALWLREAPAGPRPPDQIR